MLTSCVSRFTAHKITRQPRRNRTATNPGGADANVCRRRFLRCLASSSLLLFIPQKIEAAGKGRYIGSVVARWANNGRDMILTQPFEYIAPDGRRWPVPTGTKVDGASIPRFFWTVIGGPFSGEYRNASVVHDFYCQVRTRPYRDVHRVLYDAMMASGVTESKGWLMYQAVDQFGPSLFYSPERPV